MKSGGLLGISAESREEAKSKDKPATKVKTEKELGNKNVTKWRIRK